MKEVDYCGPGTSLALEPQVRTDGGVISLCEYPNGDVILNHSGMSVFYTNDEVMKLGNGKRLHGLLLLGHAAYVTKDEDMRIGAPGFYHNELKREDF